MAGCWESLSLGALRDGGFRSCVRLTGPHSETVLRRSDVCVDYETLEWGVLIGNSVSFQLYDLQCVATGVPL